MQEAIQTNNEITKLRQETVEKTAAIETLASKLAQQTKEINEFTYIVSHDLQAPLRMISGFMELLEKKFGDKLDGSAKQYIGFAVKGAAKMQNLVLDLLEYSRLSSVVKEFEEVDLNLVLQEVKEKLLTVIEETGAIITASNLPVIKADKKQMVQLFQHLVANAIKFRSSAVPEIDISLNKENDQWVIGVKDNGIGIDPAFSEKIFIIFRRLHNDDAKYSGTGSGLAICRKIVELHGGTIGVRSVKEQGSTFWVSLPVKVGSVQV